MNGIIHACTHPNDQDASAAISLKDMMLSIFRYIDRMVTEIVKPKKILFMAIDGVAPRAKLNQQRARRFRAAQERTEQLALAKARGEIKDDAAIFDSNCITPGTEFMDLVSKHLRWFIRNKMKNDPLWRNLDVIFSGHDVPGEGEHKIMQFIREERAKPGYPPNVRHCMYGQDADLIMLGLASHEPHFTLLREVVDFGFGKFGKTTRQVVMQQTKEAQFQLLHLSVLREYIELDFGMSCPWNVDKERLFDDFILLTFLVGNDFLPHLPTLDIGEHAFDVLFNAYRDILAESEGYLTKNGEIADFAKVEKLFGIVGRQEGDILKTRETNEASYNKNMRKKKAPNARSAEEEEGGEEERQRAYEEAFQNALMDAPVEAAGVILSSTIGKDHRGRYYYEKFKIIADSNPDGQKFMRTLMETYLEGLMWCLAYYIKGCVSWTWYFPYHYGPMLQDMRDLKGLAANIKFTLGKPFQPFQQLLGCLPPASKVMLPMPYQFLMVSQDSPLVEYYPLEFSVDMDGKKNPWEAVVLLPFIDETRLMAAESKYIDQNKLSDDDKQRNKFGKVLSYRFEPSVTSTYLSCNSEIPLPDITNCQTSVTLSEPSLAPGAYFTPKLVPGTITPIAGFPSVAVLEMQSVETEFLKVNVFGASSKYRSISLKLKEKNFDVDKLNVTVLIGRSVYVNFPMVHEAKVVAVSTEKGEHRLVRNVVKGVDDVTFIPYDYGTSKKWKTEAVAAEQAFLSGRGVPGIGGVDIGQIKMRVRVVALQGMKQDLSTGANKKVYGISEADVPIQLCLWSPPAIDMRFQETGELSVPVLMPHGCEVVAVTGQLIGCKGVVVGPHTPEDSDLNPSLKDKAAVTKKQRRVVDVEFTVLPPEPPFGYSIATSVTDVYYTSKDVCQMTGISPSLLGKVVGSIFIDNADRHDIGLNLKRNGVYQLLGYVRKVDVSNSARPSVWGKVDSVQIIGSIQQQDKDGEAESGDTCNWEYSTKVVSLVKEYKSKFPQLFSNLQKLAHAKRYTPTDLFGKGGDKQIALLFEWMKAQPFFNRQRTPLTTTSLSKESMHAIEKASDVRMDYVANTGTATLIVKGIPIESLYRGDIYTISDAPLSYNDKPPRLGDRVVNMNSLGVPFGLKGTVVAIHTATCYTEVIFDEEFVGGRSLNGNCSQFRGRLCPWSGLLRTSSDEEANKFYTQDKEQQAKAKQQAAAVPPLATGNATDKLKSLLGAKLPTEKANGNMSSLLKSKLNISSSVQPPQPPSLLPAHTAFATGKNAIPLAPKAIPKFDDDEDDFDKKVQNFVVPKDKHSDGSGKSALAIAAGLNNSSESVTITSYENDENNMSNVIAFPLVTLPVFNYRPGQKPATTISRGMFKMSSMHSTGIATDGALKDTTDNSNVVLTTKDSLTEERMTILSDTTNKLTQLLKSSILSGNGASKAVAVATEGTKSEVTGGAKAVPGAEAQTEAQGTARELSRNSKGAIKTDGKEKKGAASQEWIEASATAAVIVPPKVTIVNTKPLIPTSALLRKKSSTPKVAVAVKESI